VRKPGAFARYRYREDLFPSITFRRAYDQLQSTQGERADLDYVRLLHLAAQVGESRVAEAIVPLLDQPSTFDYLAVRACVAPPQSVIPTVRIPLPNLRAYDALLVGASA
jgi:hypothetical protein